MSNPYKNADKKERVAPTRPTKEEKSVEPTPVVETPVQPTTTSLADMIEEKPEGKTCGFYLSSEAIKKLDKTAKQLKCSRSKALDLLIRKYL